MTHKGLFVRYGFICDDARQENNGKLLFIGVYNEEIQVTQFPANLRLTAVMNITNDEPRSYDIEVKGLFGGESILGVEGQIVAGKKSSSFTPLRLPPIKISKEGRFELMFREKKKKWQPVIDVNILLIPSRQSSTVPSPLS